MRLNHLQTRQCIIVYHYSLHAYNLNIDLLTNWSAEVGIFQASVESGEFNVTVVKVLGGVACGAETTSVWGKEAYWQGINSLEPLATNQATRYGHVSSWLRLIPYLAFRGSAVLGPTPHA